MEAIIFVPALAGSVIFGFVFLLFASKQYMNVLEITGTGARQMVWSTEPILDSFWRVFYLLWLVGLWLGPAYFLGRALVGGNANPWVRLVVPFAVVWLCFPISQLSSLSASSVWIPLHPGVFARLIQKPGAVIGFMILSAGALGLIASGYRLTFLVNGIEWLFIGCPLIVLGGLIYARLLGRLAYSLAFTRSFLEGKKRKKRKSMDPSQTHRPTPIRAVAVDDDESLEVTADAEPGRQQPSNLPPIHTPDDGPITGYDVKFDDLPTPSKPAKRPKPAQRVVAEIIQPEMDALKPAAKSHDDDDDDDRSSYSVHTVEVHPDELIPQQVVRPREDEMRLISKDDTPKLVRQTWSPELFQFLFQIDTIVVVLGLSFLCLLVGGMVRIARAFVPVVDS